MMIMIRHSLCASHCVELSTFYIFKSLHNIPEQMRQLRLTDIVYLIKEYNFELAKRWPRFYYLKVKKPKY